MRTIIKGAQQNEEWRKLRLGCATGSGFADVLAEGKGKAEAVTRRNYRVRLALEIITGVPEENGFTSQAIKTGIEREPIARARFEEASGLLVEEVSFVKLDNRPVGCSPDGLIGDDGGLEVKCCTKAVHLDYLGLTDKPPSEYIAQVQGCMLVTGRSHWWFAAFNPDFPPELQLHYFRVERDDLYIKRLDDALWRFAYDVQQTVKEINDMVMERRARNQPVTNDELKAA